MEVTGLSDAEAQELCKKAPEETKVSWGMGI